MFYQPGNLLEELLKHAQYKGYFGDSCSYAGAVSPEGDAIWWISFYASLLFIVVFLPSGREELTVASAPAESEPDSNAKI